MNLAQRCSLMRWATPTGHERGEFKVKTKWHIRGAKRLAARVLPQLAVRGLYLGVALLAGLLGAAPQLLESLQVEVHKPFEL